MQRSLLWTLMQRVQHALKSGNSEAQDLAISNLQEFLDNACPEYFPAFVYPPLGRVLRYYCANTLLQLALSSEDRQYVRDVFTATLDRLEAQKQKAAEIERQMQTFMARLKIREFADIDDVLASFCRIAGIEIPEMPQELVHAYRLLGKSPFTTASLTPFLETLLKTVVSEAGAAQFTPLRYIFWDQAAEQTQMKAVLVNPFSQEVRITRLDVWTTLDPHGRDHLAFDNRVDDCLLASCRQALEIARRFLEQRFPDLLERKGIQVTCRFPDPIASYSDASVSALVGLKVVGDLLHLPVDPGAIISAEVDRSGKIRPVNHITAKVVAADVHPDVAAFYLPIESAPARVARIALRRIATFREAVEQYYGAAYQQKQQQISRRKLLKGVVGLAVAPLGFLTFKNILQHPVSEQDGWLLEYAQELYDKQSNYQKAQEILLTLLNKFGDLRSSSEINQLKAQAFTHLGVIYRQTYRHKACLAAFNKAFDYWKTLHNQGQQAEQLLHIGIAYLDTVTVSGIHQNSELALRYIHQAHDMAGTGSHSFEGRCFKWEGMAYYWLHEYDLAQKYTTASLEYFDESDLEYQVSQQYWGMELSKLGSYDHAGHILEQCLRHPALQSAWNQARNLRSLGELYFSIGDRQQALVFARQAASVTQASNSPVLTTLFQKFLTQHGLTLTTLFAE
ncbi:hypothetical protein U27_01526 [Candidatus Vecturithrix granuli]|uniref:Uncharacterized protein n=1 Tax=Vecturithrix granuli TaxID=1499967 RepID=A0A081CAM0_VECG1|nr:hypothetical protein U27_01526 [Candidatus Vecturithrix granuli]